MARGGGLPRGSVFARCFPRAGGCFLRFHPAAVSKYQPNLFKLRAVKMWPWRIFHGAQKNKFTNTRTWGASLILSVLGPQDRAERLLCVHEGLGVGYNDFGSRVT